jgi:hypothetical protein
MKCPACKFDNTSREFEKHPSITSFKSLDFSLAAIAQIIKEPEKHVKGLCYKHSFDTQWLSNAYKTHDKLKNGFLVRQVK